MYKYFFKLLSLLLVIFFILSIFVVGVTNTKLSFNALKNSLDSKYSISDNQKYIVSYFPSPSIIAFDVKILQDKKSIIDTKKLEVGFGYNTLLKILLGANPAENIDYIKVTEGKVIIDDFLDFSANQKFIDKIKLENVSITTDYLQKIKVINADEEINDYNLGKVDINLYHTAQGYKFNGTFVSNDNINVSGELVNHLKLVIKGNDLDISILPANDKAEINIDIKNFSSINTSILNSFPEYLKNNLDQESLKVQANFNYQTGLLAINEIAGSIIKGRGKETVYNQLPISLIELEYIKWGKVIDSIHENFFIDLLTNFDSSSINGYAIRAKDITFHQDKFDALKVLLVKNDDFLKLETFELKSNNQDYINASGLYDEKNSKISGKFSANLNQNKKYFIELVKYFTKYSTDFKLSENTPLTIGTDFTFTNNSIQFNNFVVREGNSAISFNYNSNFNPASKPSRALGLALFNFDFTKYNLDPVITNFIDDVFYTDITNIQNFFHTLRNLKADTLINFVGKNIVIKNKQIDDISLQSVLNLNFLKINNFVINDDDAKLTGNLELYVGRLRPILNFNITGDTLSSNMLDIIAPALKTDLPENKTTSDIWGHTLLDLPKWGKFDGSAKLRLNRISTDNFAIDHLSTDLQYFEGNMKVLDSNANLFGGALTFNGYARAFDNYLTLAFSLNGGNFELTDYNNTRLFNRLNGPYNLSGTITSSGKNQYQFIKNLKSKSQFASAGLNFQGVGLDLIPEYLSKYQYRVTANDLKLFESQASQNGETNLTNITADIQIENMLANISNIKFVSNFSAHSGVIGITLEDLNIVSTSQILSSFISNLNGRTMQFNTFLSGNIGKDVKTNIDLSPIASQLNINYK